MKLFSKSLSTSLFASVALVGVGLAGCTQNSPSTKEEVKTSDSGLRHIRVATEAAYPPFNDTTPDGRIVGFDVDVIQAACTKIPAHCDIVAQDWDGIIPGLLTNKYDAIIAGMSITPDRLEKVDFSEPYFTNTLVWLARSDGSFDPNNIKNKVLGGQRATAPAALISDKYDGKDGNRVQLYDTYTNAYLDMKAGRTDAVMAEKVSALDWLKGAGEGVQIIGDEIDNNDNLGIAVRKGDALKADFDKALAELKASGELAQIEARYFANNGADQKAATSNQGMDQAPAPTLVPDQASSENKPN